MHTSLISVIKIVVGENSVRFSINVWSFGVSLFVEEHKDDFLGSKQALDG